MTVDPVWFGAVERRLFGWFETPDDRSARGGVVICPPFGVEYASALPTLQRLSTRLASEGFAVLRFDYDGTGDSVGRSDDPDRLASWRRSVRQGAEFLAASGCERLAVVGLRMGATLAAAEMSEHRVGVADVPVAGPLDAMVLWDPCASGRTFMRQQSMLRRVIGRGLILEDGSVEGTGIVFGPDTVAELDRLSLSGSPALGAERVLVLSRRAQPLPETVRAALEGPGVEWVAVDGQECLIDVEPALVVVPEDTLDLVVEWLDKAVDGTPVPVRVPDAGVAVVGTTVDGRAIRERPLRLGPDALFAIETRPEGAVPEGAPTVLFLNAGLMDHVGPARIWVDLARALAAAGMCSLRFDMTGIGATAARPGVIDRASLIAAGLHDIAEVQRVVSPHDPSNVVLVGLCSGGYHGSEAALSSGARGVVLINPSFQISSLDEGAPSATATGAGWRGQRDDEDELVKGWVRLIPGHRVLWEAVRRAPDSAWTLINRLAIERPPVRIVRRMAEAGIDVLVACDDYDGWLVQRGGRRAVQKLAREGTVRVQVVEGMDHTLFCRQPRQLTLALIEDHLVERFAGGASGGGRAPVSSG